jgi:organic radical activating enzyme
MLNNLLYGWTKKKIDKISNSFCAAKWKQVTLHLHSGMTHSCHHPGPHKIPLDEIKVDISALHNTKFKKEQRKLMLEGERPAECNYCWKAEDSGISFSDRIIKSSSRWARPYYTEILNKKWNENINPSYLEISFSNLCNFKCSYCGPEFSTKWQDEVLKYGGYPTSTDYNSATWIDSKNVIKIKKEEENIYHTAFWDWFPSIYDGLETLRITGGEPLITKHSYKLLDYILENPNPNLKLGINSNLCVPENQLAKFLEKIKLILKTKSVKEIKIHTSAEAHKEKAEYLRHGLNYQEWYSNCNKILLENPDVKLEIMAAYNCLSVSNFKEFLFDVHLLKKTYNKFFRKRVKIYCHYLRYPAHLSIFILNKEFSKFIESQIIFMKHNNFYNDEINNLNLILDVFKNNNTCQIQNKIDFFNFINEHDRRRNTNFLKTFPELEQFYLGCNKKDLKQL